MQGRVNQYCEATLSLVIKNDTKTQLVETVIDTGFSGHLTLPSAVISKVGFPWKGQDDAILGDGTSCLFNVYAGFVIWNGEYQKIPINESESTPLIGMQLLRGYNLQIQAIESGIVTITALK